MSSLAVQRSMSLLKERGWMAEVVERWNPHAFVRHDLFGFIDILAVNDGIMTLAVQVTNYGGIEDHVDKMKSVKVRDGVKRWCRSPFRKIIIHGWFKIGPRTEWKLKECTDIAKTPTGKIKAWQCKEIEVRL